MALSHCNCTRPGDYTDGVEAHYRNIWIGQGDQRNNINIAHCESGENDYQYTVACNYSSNESASSSLVIPLIILGVAFLISLAVILKMHLRIKKLEDDNSKEEKEQKHGDQIGPSVIEIGSNQNV